MTSPTVAAEMSAFEAYRSHCIARGFKNGGWRGDEQSHRLWHLWKALRDARLAMTPRGHRRVVFRRRA